MSKRILYILVLVLTVCSNAFAQDIPASAWGNTPPIHVEGKYLVDPYGNHVVLHGFMDTPSQWFNSGRWGWGGYSTSTVTPCKTYFNHLFTATTDTASGAYANIFRLHLDPCWTDDGSVTAKGFTKKDDKWYDPNGTEVSGEANIVHFSKTRFKQYLRTVYVPIALNAIKHGFYVIMRPPGVFPHTVKVGDYYNEYLLYVWDQVSQNDSIKKYSGQISIELGNEPVNLKNANNQSDEKALHDFFQPIVDKIRSNGYEGIIWGVGTGYQSNYRDYAKYPLVDSNLGYAVHNYSGWYKGSDDNYSEAQKKVYANEVHASWPIMDSHPIVITEVDWSPQNKNEIDHYNEFGQPTYKNFGTWATGSTSKWGAMFKYMMDSYDNVSMTLSSTGCYIDIDSYVKSVSPANVPKKVVPAFEAKMNAAGVNPMEASGVACFKWYKEWAKVDYARPDLLKVEADLTEFNIDKENVTCMVGQTVDFGGNAKWADGLTSRIPASLCNMTADNDDVCGDQDGQMVALNEGTANVAMTFKGKGGDAFKRQGTVTVLPAFSLSVDAINPSILLAGTYTEKRYRMKTANGGIVGWDFNAGLNISDYKYLIVKFKAKPTCAPVIVVSDNSNPCAPRYEQAVGTDLTVKIDLQNMKKNDGTAVNTSDIRMVGISSNGSAEMYLAEVFLSNDGETSAIASATVSGNAVAEEYYNAAGQRVATPQGVTIVRQTLTNGEKRTVKRFK